MVAISTVWADDTLSPDSTNEKLGDSPLIGEDVAKKFANFSTDIVAGPDLPLPGQYVSVSQLAQIETPTSQGDSQIIQEPKVANQNQDERSPPMSPISTLKLTSSVEKKEKQKQTAKSATSKKSKKKEVSSSSEPTSVCYGIERSLQLYRGNIKQLTEYLASLSPDKIFKGSNSTNGGMLESSVIADLLLSVTLCYGTVLSDWDRVFYWYESCSTTISSKEFKFILMLLSNDQKDEMRRCLESSRGVSGEDERLDSILRTYELIQ